MISRRDLLLSTVVLGLAAGPSLAQEGSGTGGPPPPPENAVMTAAIAVTRVFGDGQRLVAVALAFDRPIRTASVTAGAFSVEGRRIDRAYAGTTAEPAAEGRDGPFVILELSPDDAAAPLWLVNGPRAERRLPRALVQLTGASLVAVEGSAVLPMAEAVDCAVIRNLVVDDFVQGRFEDAQTGLGLGYNLFVPRDYDPAQSYPLVLFMHDAGVTGPVVDTTLVQGLGAVAFATPDDQRRHPAFVLAPQYDVQIANDASETTGHLDATVNLLQALVAQYRIDPRRLYVTGQSGGGMTAIAMNLKYPGLIAASLLVACQWDAALCAPLADKKLWVVVAQGDTKAFPGQNAIMEVIEAAGTPVSRAVWQGTASAEDFAAEVRAQAGQGARVNYTALAEGTVTLPGQEGGASDHRGTWRIAYGIGPLRDWLFEQSL